MIEFTKEQRHEIYKKAKELYLKNPLMVGMCIAIKETMRELFYNHLDYINIEYLFILDEFMSLQPSHIRITDYWWVGERHNNNKRTKESEQIRLKKFDQIIKETKIKHKNE